MPRRSQPLITGQYYHLANHGIDGRLTFTNPHTYKRFLISLWYYQLSCPPTKLSTFLLLKQTTQQQLLHSVPSHPEVAVIAFCLLPDHFHLIVQQLAAGGISRYLARLANGYTRYFNLQTHRTGPLFLPRFQAAPLTGKNELKLIARYIHLQPYQQNLLHSHQELKIYPWSSLPQYLGTENTQVPAFCHTQELDRRFQTIANHTDFLFNHRDYISTLPAISSLLLEPA